MRPVEFRIKNVVRCINADRVVEMMLANNEGNSSLHIHFDDSNGGIVLQGTAEEMRLAYDTIVHHMKK